MVRRQGVGLLRLRIRLKMALKKQLAIRVEI